MPILANRYELAEMIYSDAVVVAYCARDQLLNRTVTIEWLQANRVADAAAVQRLLDKARSAALLNLPHVAALYDQHIVDNRPFLVLEEIAGPALADAAPLSAEQATDLVYSVADTIHAALARQQPLPAITEQTIRIGPEGRIQIIDLGLAQPAPEDAIQTLGRLLQAALGGTAEASPLRGLAERAIAGQYASVDALVADLRLVQQRATTATTVMPRVHPTIDLTNDSGVTAYTAANTAATPAPAPAAQPRRYLWAGIGAGGLILLALLGSLWFRGRDETALDPVPSAVATVGASNAPAGSPIRGELYTVATNNRRPIRVRQGPGLNSPQIASLPYGTTVEVIDGPQPADGYNWVRIRTSTVDGWCIREGLRKQ